MVMASCLLMERTYKKQFVIFENSHVKSRMSLLCPILQPFKIIGNTMQIALSSPQKATSERFNTFTRTSMAGFCQHWFGLATINDQKSSKNKQKNSDDSSILRNAVILVVYLSRGVQKEENANSQREQSWNLSMRKKYHCKNEEEIARPSMEDLEPNIWSSR